jgi:hypothetical protein
MMRKLRLLTVVLVLMVGLPTAVAIADVTPYDDPGTRPPGCGSHFKDRDPRERTVNKASVLHEMSNPPVCSPHGPVLGNMIATSHFVVYYADPGDPLWCYGYSVQLAKDGYMLCSDYD